MKQKAPAHLAQPTAVWWQSVVDEYELDEHHKRLLTLAAESWDRCVQAREAIAVHGLTFVDRFGSPHARPEVAVERDCKIGFARLVREIGLDLFQPDESRPNKLRGGK